MASLNLHGIEKSYGSLKVVHGIDLAIADGEFIVLVGPSGCGKSTLLRMIAGLEAITEGLQLLRRFPFTCRKVGASPFLRELVIPFGHAGYVALFEIVNQTTVVVAAVRHQRESDFH